jgi:anti-sigma regulatory factor (Ser/Thr protein kinase)
MATDETAPGPVESDMHTILLPALPAHLSTIHAFLEREIPEDFLEALSKIEIAVEELFMNIFHHAYAAKGQGKAMISCRLVDLDGAVFFGVGLRDWGRPYNPFAEAPRPDLDAGIEERPIGGLGIHIVRTVAAHYCYSRSQDANELELFFAPTK